MEKKNIGTEHNSVGSKGQSRQELNVNVDSLSRLGDTIEDKDASEPDRQKHESVT